MSRLSPTHGGGRGKEGQVEGICLLPTLAGYEQGGRSVASHPSQRLFYGVLGRPEFCGVLLSAVTQSLFNVGLTALRFYKSK